MKIKNIGAIVIILALAIYFSGNLFSIFEDDDNYKRYQITSFESRQPDFTFKSEEHIYRFKISQYWFDSVREWDWNSRDGFHREDKSLLFFKGLFYKDGVLIETIDANSQYCHRAFTGKGSYQNTACATCLTNNDYDYSKCSYCSPVIEKKVYHEDFCYDFYIPIIENGKTIFMISKGGYSYRDDRLDAIHITLYGSKYDLRTQTITSNNILADGQQYNGELLIEGSTFKQQSATLKTDKIVDVDIYVPERVIVGQQANMTLTFKNNIPLDYVIEVDVTEGATSPLGRHIKKEYKNIDLSSLGTKTVTLPISTTAYGQVNIEKIDIYIFQDIRDWSGNIISDYQRYGRNLEYLMHDKYVITKSLMESDYNVNMHVMIIPQEYAEMEETISVLEMELADKVAYIQNLTDNINIQAQYIDELELNYQEKAIMIENLQTTIENQSRLLNEMEATRQEQALIIENMDLTIKQQASLIANLTSKSKEQAEIINNLNLDINKKQQIIIELNKTIEDQKFLIFTLRTREQQLAELIDNLEATLDEKALIIADLTQENEEQSAIIKELNINLQEKAYLISQLTSENEEQAELINQMELSFSDQLEIIRAMNLTIEEDKLLISNLDLSVKDQQRMINELEIKVAESEATISQMRIIIESQTQDIQNLREKLEQQGKLLALYQLTIEEDAQLIQQLTNNVDEQALIISQLQLSNEEMGNLISEMNLKISRQTELINQLNLSVRDSGEIIKNLQLTIQEDKEIIESLNLEISEQAIIISQLELSAENEQMLIELLDLTTEERNELLKEIKHYRKYKWIFDYWEVFVLGIGTVIGIVVVKRFV